MDPSLVPTHSPCSDDEYSRGIRGFPPCSLIKFTRNSWELGWELLEIPQQERISKEWRIQIYSTRRLHLIFVSLRV